MEFSIFPKHEDLLKKFVEIRLHTDHKDEKLEKAALELQLKMAGTKALPIYILVDPNHPEVPISKIAGADPPGSSRFSVVRLLQISVSPRSIRTFLMAVMSSGGCTPRALLDR